MVELGEQVEVLMKKLRSIGMCSAAHEEMLINIKQMLETKEEKLKMREVMMKVTQAAKSKMRFLT